MRLRFTLLAVPASLALAGACIAATMEPQPPGPAPMCAIQIEFQERQHEIDMRTFDRVMRYVETSTIIARAFDERRAAGEAPALCLVIETEKQALAVFEQLTYIIPPQRAKLPRVKPPPPVVPRYKGG